MPLPTTTARRRTGVAIALTLVAALATIGDPSAGAQAAPAPVVTVSATGATGTSATDCRGQHRTTIQGEVTFTVSRTGDTTDALDVDVERTGDLAAGLPDPVTIPAGQASTLLTVDPPAGYQGRLQLLPGTGYDVGTPSSAEAQVLLVVADLACGLGFPGGYEETIVRGTRPTDLDLAEEVGPVAGRAMELEGAAPAGLTFRSDGTWTGTATEVGTTTFAAYFCDDDGWCPFELDLTIRVVDGLTATPRPTPAPAPPAATPIATSPTFTG